MLPVQTLDEFDVTGIIFSHFPNDTDWNRARQDIELSITDDAVKRQEQFRKLCIEGRSWNERQQKWWEKAIEEETLNNRVISPWTLHLYFIREQIGLMGALKPWEIEKRFLAAFPGQFHAHYTVNQNDPNAKPWEEDDNLEENPKGYLVCTGKKIDWDDAESQHMKAMAKLDLEIGETAVQPTKKSAVSEPGAAAEKKPEISPVYFIDLALKGF